MKFRFIVLSILLFLSGADGLVMADEIRQKLQPTVSVAIDAEGYATFSDESIQYLNQGGEPALPYQVVKLLLPPDAVLATASVSLEVPGFEELAGTWEIRPTPPESTWDGTKVITVWPSGKTILDGRDVDIYNVDALFPTSILGETSSGQMRQWQLLEVPVASYKYNPVSKRLYRLAEAELVVTFTRTGELPSGSVDRLLEGNVKRLTANFQEVAPSYYELAPSAITPLQTTYAVITTEAIQSASGELANFVQSKQRRGFNVEVITENVWGGGVGDMAAENIRSWLQTNYLSKTIEYVLLIGNPDPTLGDVPMKMLWPRNNATFYTQYKDSPSDYYYADLTGSWDLDGDGFYGEWGDDFGAGGVDRNWEVLVGRIPYYGDITDLDNILAKFVTYENASRSDASWRSNVLLPMEPSDGSTPGYHLGEEIKDAILVPKTGWNYHRVYDDDYGLIPLPETIPTTEDNVTNAWNGSQFGAVVWWTHGWERGAVGIMDLTHAATLDDMHPGFTFQVSCTNSKPEDTQNLSYSLLKNGGINTIGATRVSWYNIGQKSFAGTTSNSGMSYEYAQRLITEGNVSSLSLNDLKQVLSPGSSTLWMNYTDFNIYGDPSVGLFSFNSDFVLTANEQNTIEVRFSQGDGTFELPVFIGENLGINYSEFAIADFTGDGLQDFIAATDENPARLYLFTRTGFSSFQQSFIATLDADSSGMTDYGLGFTSADLDNDGDIDFLENINVEFTEGYWVAKGNAYLNDGAGNFAKVQDAFDFSTIFNHWTLAKSSTLADVDGDGFPDMLASEQSSGGTVNSMVYLLKGKGDGTFQAPVHVFTTNRLPATHMTLGDFNNDGKVDALIGQDDDGDPGAVYLFFGKGNGSFVEPGREVFDVELGIESGSDQPGAGNFQAYDANNDGILDIISAYKKKGIDDSDESSALVFIEGSGNGYFKAPQLIDSSIIFRTAFQAPLNMPTDTFILQGADLNNDACVDRTDLTIILNDIRASAPHDPYFDLNQDGIVNIADARNLVLLFSEPRGAACP